MTRGRSRAGSPAILRRAFVANGAPITTIAVLTLVLAFVGVLTPQLTLALVTRGLRYDVGQATPLQRDLTATFLGAPAGSQWSGFDADLQTVRREMPSPLASASAAASYATTSSRLSIDEFAGGLQESYLALGSSPQFFGHVRFVEGSIPATAEVAPARAGGQQDASDADGQLVSLGPVATGTLSMALSRSTASALHWKVGETHTLRLSDGGTQNVRLTGVFVARDSGDDYWGHVFQTLEPEIMVGPDGGRIPVGAGWVTPASLPVLSVLPGDGYTSPLKTAAWYPLRASTLSPSSAPGLADASRHFTAVRHQVPSAGEGPLTFSTQLAEVLSGSRARSTTAQVIVDASIAGPFGAALALELLATRMAVARAREALALIGARGAGRPALRAVAAGLVGLLSVPAAALGAVLGFVAASAADGAWALPQPVVGPAVVLASIVAALLPAVLAAALVPSLVGRPSAFPVRLVAEGVLLAVAAVSVVLVVRQGLSSDAGGSTVDPVSVALPLVLALCGCVGALRILPTALERLRRRATKRRGVALSTGLAVAARSRTGLGAALLAATVGLSVALFAGVVGSTLQHGLAQAAAGRVGADVEVATNGLDFTTELPFGKVRGVDRVAFVSNNATTQIAAGPRSVRVSIVVVDAARLRAVQTGVSGAMPLPTTLTADSDSSVPVVASKAIADRLAGFRPEVDGTRLRVVGRASDSTSLVPGSQWIVVDQKFASALAADNDAPDQTLLRLTSGADPGGVADRVRDLVGSGAAVTTTRAVESRLQQDPLVPGIRLIALEAAVLGAVFGTAALVMTVLLDTGPRRRRIRLLTLLGLDRFQRRRLVLGETLPLGVTALAAGIVVAAAMVALVLPSADLRSFTGGTARPAVHVDPGMVVGFVLTGAVVILLVSLLAVRLGGRLLTTRPDTEDAE